MEMTYLSIMNNIQTADGQEFYDKVNLFMEIHHHLLEDEKPSDYLNKVSDKKIFRMAPFSMLIKLKETMQSPVHHPEGKVVSLVRYHMHILYVLKDLPFGNMDLMKERVELHELALLGLCDRLGRLNVNRKEEEENITNFLSILNNTEKVYCGFSAVMYQKTGINPYVIRINISILVLWK